MQTGEAWSCERRRIFGRAGENDEPREWPFIARLRAFGRDPGSARWAWLASAKARALQAGAAGRTAEAIRLFEQARTELPYVDAEVEANLAELRTIRRLEQRLEVRPNDVRALVQLGQAYFLQERDGASLACLRKALALAPRCAEAHSLLAAELHYRGEYEAAVAEYRTALELCPADARSAGYLPQAIERTPPRDSWTAAAV